MTGYNLVGIMNIKEFINRNNKEDKQISQYDYKTISTQTDQLYNALLYRDIYPLENREEKYKELLNYINYFHKLPKSKKITKLKYLDRLHNLYLGNLALCNGEIEQALEYYFDVLSVHEINQKTKDIRSKKCSRIELCDLMPLVYNIEEMFKLCGLDMKAKEYMSLCMQPIAMWTEKMQEKKPDGFVFPALKDSMCFSKSGYEFCCEEYYDKNIGRMNYRFNSGLDDFDTVVPEIINKDGKDYYKLGYCSDLLDIEKLKTTEAAKIVANIRIA